MTPPIYRARRKDNGEWMTSKNGMWWDDCYGGCFKPYFKEWNSFGLGYYQDVEIDPTTLAISFEDMIDKNGKRIFAALNENGVGGSLIADGSFDDDESFWKGKVIWSNKFQCAYVYSKYASDFLYRYAPSKQCEVFSIYEGYQQ